MNKKRTIYNIAKELDLAPGTISKVINNTGNVSDSTRKRVLAYIKKVGYVPNNSARMLKSKRTYTVGIVFTEESDVGLEHSFFSSILQHFKTFVEVQGYELSFIVKKLGQHELSYYEWCMNKRVDGVYIVVGNYDDKGLYELVESSIPAVSTDMLLPKLHTVISDNDQGVKLIFDYIKEELKLKNIAYISGPKSSKAFNERVDAYHKYTQEYQLNQTSEVIYADSFGFTSGYNAVYKLLKKPEQKPELIMVASDDIALGVLKGLSDMHIKVPEDIQVVGFDDIAFSKHFTPSLTTIRQDRKLLGQTAARLLIELMDNPNKDVSEIVKLPVELVIRESTRKK
ncbi:LacI family DNA-binding transcriptional regulator [Mariniplasma anaerobium]|uniref:LacI family transcriptional regulator n=1 Tax=Mariniplasma anaerobium TaxID=2735436 RepID=A0A7U9TGX9_9MOLU|nr:LacI family DNA-binding transcriptional regulator [Mariniplasma anaerobium]BCR35787.1 LacI family transcriptional regulator [Mariniplasma anaerobium]